MQLQFNAQTVQPSQPMEPIPDGWYPNIIKSTEPKKVNGSDTKWYLNVEHEIIDGPFKGRKVFNNLNIGNDNQQAVDIAYRDLSAMCHVTGRYTINDSNELCNIPFQIKVTVEGSNNRIKGYKDMQGNDPGKTGAVQGGGQPQQAAMPPAAGPGPANAQWGGQPAGAATYPPANTQPVAGAWGGGSTQAQPPAAGNAQPWGGGQPTTNAAPPAGNGQPAWQPNAGGPPAGGGGAAPWQR